MDEWFFVSINGGTGYMLVRDGSFVGYFASLNVPIEPQPGTTVYTIENNVAPPNA